MLKISIHDGVRRFQFRLEGKLTGLWVKELEQCWNTASSTFGGKELLVDLAELDYIDDAGKHLFSAMHQAGAHFHAVTDYQRSIVRDATGELPEPDKETAPSKCNRIFRRLGAVFFFSSALLILHEEFAIAAPLSMQNEQPAGTLRLTMKEAVSRALAQNPQVQIANLNVAISQAEGTISRSALLPQASFEASQLVRKINTATSFGREFSLIPKGIGPFPVIQMGPVASVPLFDLTLWKRWRIAQQNVNVSRAQESVVREQTVLLTVSQYLSSMRAAASVKAAQSRVDLAKAIFDQATNLQQAGAGTGIDTLRANVELQAEKQRLIVASTQLETSLFALSKLLNLPTEQRIELGDELRYEPASAPEPAPIAVAYNQRPDLQTVIERLKTANLRKDLTRAEWLPKVSFNGAWTPAGVHYTDMIPTYQYEVSLSVPIFTAGRIRAEQKRAALDLERTQKDEQDTKNQIAQEAKTSRAELESAIQEVEVSNLGVQLAQEEVVQARDRFQAGVANTVEVVTAQDRLARANDDQISALYRYNQARADLARAYGQLQSTYAK